MYKRQIIRLKLARPERLYIERDDVMKGFAVLLLLGLICFFTGCTQYYYQEGKSFNECASARKDCYAELQKRLADDSRSSIGYENKFMEDCMKRKGYRLVTEDKLPLEAKRQDPDSSLKGFIYGYRRGIAGALDEK
jgi:hypothetical protein